MDLLDPYAFSGVAEAFISGKINIGGITPIIGNQMLGRIYICLGVIVNHMPFRVNQSFKLSLNPQTRQDI